MRRSASRLQRPLLAALCTASLLSACGPSDPGADEAAAGSDPAHGEKLYATRACASCHGGKGAGLSTAPGFAGLDDHWTREQLAEYLGNPRAWIDKDARLRELKRRYSMEMPAFGAPLPDRLALADHVLRLAAELP